MISPVGGAHVGTGRTIDREAAGAEKSDSEEIVLLLSARVHLAALFLKPADKDEVLNNTKIATARKDAITIRTAILLGVNIKFS